MKLSDYDFVITGALLHDIWTDAVSGGHFGNETIPQSVFTNYMQQLITIKNLFLGKNKPKLIWYKQCKVKERRTRKSGKYFRNKPTVLVICIQWV